MTRVYLLLNQIEDRQKIYNLLNNSGIDFVEAEGQIEDYLTQILNYLPDIILIDNRIENCEFIVRQIKSASKNQNMQIIMLLDSSLQTDFLNLADGLVELPLSENVLSATLNSHLKIKKSLDRLYENNK